MTAPIIHKTKHFQGEDPRKVFWETTLERKLCPCGTPAAMKITTSMLISDLPIDLRAMTMIAIGERRLKPFRTTKGFAIRTGEIFACTMHRKAAEIAAAKGPSYAMVDFDYGPGEEGSRAYVGVVLPDGTIATDLLKTEEPASLIIAPPSLL